MQQWTYEEFKAFVNQPGAVSMITYEWMTHGCPKCDCKKWTVTCDYWAYCLECGAGFSTEYPMATIEEVIDTICFDDNGNIIQEVDNEQET